MMTRRKLHQSVGLMALLALIPFLASSCATIPKESVKLSESLGTMISNSRSSQINLVNRYFSERIEGIRTFALDEYKPAFMKNVQKRLKDQGQEFTFDRYDQAMGRVQKKVDEWVAEAETERAQVLDAVNQSYDRMTRANESVTSLLRSASQVEETRKALTGDLEKQAGNVVDFEKLDQKMQGILNKVQQAKGLLSPQEE